MANPEIIEYAKEQLKAGHAIDEIKDTLIKIGWSKEEVDEAISIVQTEIPTAPETPTAAGFQPASKKAVYGLVLSIAAGLLIILNIIRISAPSLEDVVINIFGFLPLTTEHMVLTLVSGILMIVGAFLAYKGFKGKIGGILVIVFSVIYLISAGYIIFFIIGIIGGLLALIKK